MELLSGHEKIITKSGISLNAGTLNRGFALFSFQGLIDLSFLLYFELSLTVMIILVPTRQSRPHPLKIVWNHTTSGTGVKAYPSFKGQMVIFWVGNNAFGVHPYCENGDSKFLLNIFMYQGP
jgi:hypothetical protein